MFRPSVWKIIGALFIVTLIQSFAQDYVLGIPDHKRDKIDLVALLEVHLMILCISTATTLFCSLIWSSDLPYVKVFKFLFPRIWAIWMSILIIVVFGGAYYVATVKYGLQVW